MPPEAGVAGEGSSVCFFLNRRIRCPFFVFLLFQKIVHNVSKLEAGMKYACYRIPGGEQVTPEEFIRRASPEYKKKGIFPYCPACGIKVELYGDHNPNVPSRFDHPNLPKGTDPLDDCILANRGKRFQGLQPEKIDPEYGKSLRKNFFEIENLKKAYFFMWKICGKGTIPFEKVRGCIVRADKKGIWKYEGLPIWCVPYILLTFENFAVESRTPFHFFIDKKKTTYINDIWKTDRTRLVKVYSDSGRAVKSNGIENPVEISEIKYNDITANISWDTSPISLKIRNSFCRASY